jgi:hypothetical protein
MNGCSGRLRGETEFSGLGTDKWRWGSQVPKINSCNELMNIGRTQTSNNIKNEFDTLKATLANKEAQVKPRIIN